MFKNRSRFSEAYCQSKEFLKESAGKNQKNLIIVTPTYVRKKRLQYFKRIISVFEKVSNLIWIVVEDGDSLDDQVKDLLAKSRIRHIYLNYGPTRCWGNAQRDQALKYIKKNKLQGLVYLADDDNYYDIRLFEEIRKTNRVSIFPVGLLGPSGVERPVVKNGKIIGWDAHWKERKFPVDMAGFAFDFGVLIGLKDPLWAYDGRGGETEFLERLVDSQDELEILCEGCTKCYVWHNQPLNENYMLTYVKMRLKQYFWRIRNLW